MSISALSSLSNAQIYELQKNLDQELKDRKEQIAHEFGPMFSGIVGIDRIFNLKVVSSEELNLSNDPKYPSHRVLPKHLGEDSAVRGMLDSKRPFLAIKVERTNLATQEVNSVVEVIFKRCSPPSRDVKKGSVYDNLMVTAINNRTESGASVHTDLYGSGGMTKQQMEAVRDLLDGKEIPSFINEGWTIKMV